jgi:hypothetical protein
MQLLHRTFQYCTILSATSSGQRKRQYPKRANSQFKCSTLCFPSRVTTCQREESTMARSRKANSTPSTSSPSRSGHSSPDRPTGPLSITIDSQEREEVKVNNANLIELKNACDDALKRVCPSCPNVSLFISSSNSSCQDQIYSSKYISTQMSSLL